MLCTNRSDTYTSCRPDGNFPFSMFRIPHFHSSDAWIPDGRVELAPCLCLTLWPIKIVKPLPDLAMGSWLWPKRHGSGSLASPVPLHFWHFAESSKRACCLPGPRPTPRHRQSSSAAFLTSLSCSRWLSAPPVSPFKLA